MGRRESVNSRFIFNATCLLDREKSSALGFTPSGITRSINP
jgi:hypothetical protein